MNTLVKHPQNYAMDSAFDNLVKEVFGADESRFNPVTNVYQTDSKYQVDIALPGFVKDNITLNIEEDVLKISGENKVDAEGISYTKQNIPFGKFEKSYKLPKYVAVEKIEAEFNNGILSVSIPKQEKEEYTKTIEIK